MQLPPHQREAAQVEAWTLFQSDDRITLAEATAYVVTRRLSALQPSPAEQRASDKAEYRLSMGVRLARAREAVLVPSATTAGVVYRVEGGRCNCKAGQAGRPCWHVKAAELQPA